MRSVGLAVAAVLWSTHLMAVDSGVLQQSMRTTPESVQPEENNNRFSLVGVIAEGAEGGKGIAVIKDRIRDKTHTLKVGDSIAGLENIKLIKVHRKFAVLSNAGVSFEVSVNAEPKPEDLEKKRHALLEDDLDVQANTKYKDKDPSLFDKWSQRQETVLVPVVETRISRDLPTDIRTPSQSSSDSVTAVDEFDTETEEESDLDLGDDRPAIKTEYSEEIRNLVEKYLNEGPPTVTSP